MTLIVVVIKAEVIWTVITLIEVVMITITTIVKNLKIFRPFSDKLKLFSGGNKM